MLARLAENLFWAGRYVERAEDTARMVDVTYHTLLESSSVEVSQSWMQLLDVLSARSAFGDRAPEPAAVMRFLVLDPDHDGSITACVARARENVRSVRELVSSELWEAVNDLYLAMRSRDLAHELTDQPHGLFSFVRRSSMTIYGVASETMPRDEGWRFMALGRLLERAEMTCRLLEVRYPQLERLAEASRRPATSTDERPRGADRVDFHHWIAVLKSASAFEAYRRRYRASMDPVDVAEFLLLAPDLPRSVLYCLLAASAQVDELCGGVSSPAARRLGRVTASLQYRDVSELFDIGLHEFLDQVQVEIGLVTEAVAAEFFRHHPDGSMHAIVTP